MKAALRHELFRVLVASVVLQLVLTLVAGWVIASFFVSIAGIAFMVGHTRGFKQGADFGLALFLEGKIQELDQIEEWMIESGEFAPDSEERIGLAKTRGELQEQLRKVA